MAGATLRTASEATASQSEWSDLPELPLAVSGHFTGVSGGALIVAGGAYFPTPLFEGGTKVWTDQIAVLERGARTWRTGYFLRNRLAYGASITTPEGLICIGGGDAKRHSREVFLLRWHRGKLEREELPPLPDSCAFHAAAMLDEMLYVAGGQEAPDAPALRTFWTLSLTRRGASWRHEEAWPGPARILPVLVAQAGSLYLAGGCALHRGPDGKPTREYLKDAYRYTPGSGWTRIEDAPRALTAAPALASGRSEVRIFGGDDGEHAQRIQELKDRHPGFCKDILVLDTRTHRWRREGTLPVGLVTTSAVRWGSRVVIPGGEDRPGHRLPRVIASPAD